MKIKSKIFKAALILSTFLTSAPIFIESAYASSNSHNKMIKSYNPEKSKISVGKYKFTDDAFAQVKLPNNYNNSVFIKNNDSKIVSVKLPINARVRNRPTISNDTETFNGKNENISVNNTNQGFQSLIKIKNNNALKTYSYRFKLPKGYRIMTSRQYLGKKFNTGEVYIVDKRNIVQYILDKPWAKDHYGKNVPTSFIVNGNTITQKVNFNKNSMFPIIADPSFWKIIKCAGSISWALGSSIFGALKILKIKKYIKAAGGIKKVAISLLKAKGKKKKLMKIGGKALLNFAAILSGVDGVISNCK